MPLKIKTIFSYYLDFKKASDYYSSNVQYYSIKRPLVLLEERSSLLKSFLSSL
jgi:hypothetical protein